MAFFLTCKQPVARKEKLDCEVSVCLSWGVNPGDGTHWGYTG